MRRRRISTALLVVAVLVGVVTVTIWNIVDTQVPVAPVQLSP